VFVAVHACSVVAVPHHHITTQLRPWIESSPPWKPQILPCYFLCRT